MNLNQPKVARSTGAIVDATDELDKEVGMLHEVLTCLETRLSPITHSRTAAGSEATAATDTGVPLANTIHRSSYNISEARSRINLLLESIAL